MEYNLELFVRKGNLNKLWLAGTSFYKLSKKAILRTDVKAMCHSIAEVDGDVALATRARLMLGISRIFEKRVYYLHNDAMTAQVNETLSAPGPVNLNLPECKQHAKNATITICLGTDVDLSMFQIPEDIFLDQSFVSSEVPSRDQVLGLDDSETTTVNQYFGDLLYDVGRDFNNTIDELSIGSFNFDIPSFNNDDFASDSLSEELNSVVDERSHQFDLDSYSSVEMSLNTSRSRLGFTLETSYSGLRPEKRRCTETTDRCVEISSVEISLQLQDPKRILNPRHQSTQSSKDLLSHDFSILTPWEIAFSKHAQIQFSSSVLGTKSGQTSKSFSPAQFEPLTMDLDIEVPRYEPCDSSGSSSLMFLGQRLDDYTDKNNRLSTELKLKQPALSTRSRVTSEGSSSPPVKNSRLSMSQFELPQISVRDIDEETNDPISPVTCIFLEAIDRAQLIYGAIVGFSDVLLNALGITTSRVDAARAFSQCLLLGSLDILNLKQDLPYGPIYIMKGTKFGTTFIESHP